MLSIIGMNFALDSMALESMGTYRDTVKTVEVGNGIFDQLYIEHGIDKPYTPNYTTEWDLLTIMSAGFNNTLNAGNIDYMLSVIKGVRLKRRKVGDSEWATLAEYALEPNSSLNFNMFDNTAETNTHYEYAIVPVLDFDTNQESTYMTDEIMTCFDGVYICDADTIYRFYAGVSFGNGEQKNVTGIYEPMGRKYPIVVANGMTNYYKSSMKATVIMEKDLYNSTLDRKAEVEYRKGILDFLTNHKPKIIKDWNGNSWLVMIVDNPQVEPNNLLGFGYSDIEANFVEVGDANSTEDLRISGITK